MSPIGSHHAACVKYFNQFLQPFLGDQFLLSIQAPIQLGNLSEPEPDIALLKSQSDFYPARHPQANDVVAILEIADSSLNYDREVKKLFKISFCWRKEGVLGSDDIKFRSHNGIMAEKFYEIRFQKYLFAAQRINFKQFLKLNSMRKQVFQNII